jgi:hypothetical protein
MGFRALNFVYFRKPNVVTVVSDTSLYRMACATKTKNRRLEAMFQVMLKDIENTPLETTRAYYLHMLTNFLKLAEIL